jgi:hypothetical protein
MDNLDDFELMSRIQKRDRQAWITLKGRYSTRLREIAYAVLKNNRRSDTVVRQVLEFCWSQASLFNLTRDRSVALWLYELTGFLSEEQLRQPLLRFVQDPLKPKRRRGLWAGILTVLGLIIVALSAYGLTLTYQYWLLHQYWIQEAKDSKLYVQQTYTAWQSQPTVRRISLEGVRQGNVLAHILWSPKEKKVLFSASNLPPPPLGKRYHLWVTTYQDDGTNLPGGSSSLVEKAGAFTAFEQEQTQWLSGTLLTDAPSLITVTLEPIQGSEDPTGPILLQAEMQTESTYQR